MDASKRNFLIRSSAKRLKLKETLKKHHFKTEDFQEITFKSCPDRTDKVPEIPKNFLFTRLDSLIKKELISLNSTIHSSGYEKNHMFSTLNPDNPKDFVENECESVENQINRLPSNRIIEESRQSIDKFQLTNEENVFNVEENVFNVEENEIRNSVPIEPRKSVELFINKFQKGIQNIIIKPTLIEITVKKTNLKLGFVNSIMNDYKDFLLKTYKFPNSFETLDQGLVFEYLPTRWPGGKIPFTFTSELKLDRVTMESLTSSLKIFNESKVIKFVESKPEDQDFVEFHINSKFEAEVEVPVGRYPGKNLVVFPSRTSKPAVLHILMHVIGFTHQSMSKDKKDFYCYLFSNNFPREYQENSLSSNLIIIKNNFYGPYDKNSVMHLPACSKIRDCSKAIIINNVKKLSKLDIEKIRFFYGNQKCSADVFKDPFVQSHFYCVTCWGNSQIPICAYCCQVHHQKHHIKFVNFGIEENKEVKCACGSLKHVNQCSKGFKSRQKVEGFKCVTCSDSLDYDGNVVVCYQCSEICHSDHVKESFSDIESSECSCGFSELNGKKKVNLTISGCCLSY